jgi:hypothetical protein
MAKRRRKTRTNLGAPPAAHAKALRRHLRSWGENADRVQELAKAGKCHLAQMHYEDAHFDEGAARAERDGIGRHGKKLNITPNMRKTIAARKALETHCGRQKAY